jgi:hypothetical protein
LIDEEGVRGNIALEADLAQEGGLEGGKEGGKEGERRYVR